MNVLSNNRDGVATILRQHYKRIGPTGSKVFESKLARALAPKGEKDLALSFIQVGRHAMTNTGLKEDAGAATAIFCSTSKAEVPDTVMHKSSIQVGPKSVCG